MTPNTALKELPPVRVNFRVVAWTGTAVWALALAALLVIQLAAHVEVMTWIWVCVTGVLLGLVAQLYLRLPHSQATRMQDS